MGYASIVGLGEETHGTHEFYAIKARQAEFLIAKMGFTTFIMENDWGTSQLIDAYINGGPGNIDSVMLDLRKIPPGPVAVWANGPATFLNYGLGGEDLSTTCILRQWFEVIIHVQKTIPSHPF